MYCSNDRYDQYELHYQLRMRISQLAHANGMSDDQYLDYILMPNGFSRIQKNQDWTAL